MHKVYRVFYRGSCQAINIRPRYYDLLAASEQEAKKKFRQLEPNADIVDIRVIK